MTELSELQFLSRNLLSAFLCLLSIDFNAKGSNSRKKLLCTTSKNGPLFKLLSPNTSRFITFLYLAVFQICHWNSEHYWNTNSGVEITLFRNLSLFEQQHLASAQYEFRLNKCEIWNGIWKNTSMDSFAMYFHVSVQQLHYVMILGLFYETLSSGFGLKHLKFYCTFFYNAALFGSLSPACQWTTVSYNGNYRGARTLFYVNFHLHVYICTHMLRSFKGKENQNENQKLNVFIYSSILCIIQKV